MGSTSIALLAATDLEDAIRAWDCASAYELASMLNTLARRYESLTEGELLSIGGEIWNRGDGLWSQVPCGVDDWRGNFDNAYQTIDRDGVAIFYGDDSVWHAEKPE